MNKILVKYNKHAPSKLLPKHGTLLESHVGRLGWTHVAMGAHKSVSVHFSSPHGPSWFILQSVLARPLHTCLICTGRRMKKILRKMGGSQPQLQPQRGHTIFIMGLIACSVPITCSVPLNAPESTKIFDAAADILQADVKAYRTFFNALGDPDNDPFFSVENAPNWITSHGYQLFLQSDESTVVSRNPEDASPRQLKAYRKFILSDEYITHPFFSLENTVTWINPVSFQTYMDLQYSSQQYLPVQHLELVHLRDPTPCASSWYSIAPLSRASSPVSFVSEIPSRPPSSMSMDGIILNDSDQEFPTHVSGPLPRTESVYTSLLEISQVQPLVNAVARVERSPSPTFSATSNVKPRKSIRRKGKGRAEADSSRIKITRQLYVNEIVDMAVQSTWTVPRVPTAYRVDISKFEAQLAICGGKSYALWINYEVSRTKNLGGDRLATLQAMSRLMDEGVLARRCQFYCNGVDTYEFIDPELFAGCERYKPDIEQMQELWNHELEANELEAASAPSIMSRFYSRIINSRCKIQCDGIPIMVPLSRVVILVSFLLPTEYKIIQGPSSHGKKFFIGCSRWSKDERFEHIYWPIAANINEDILRFVMDNNGRVPNAETTVNETCVLTVHPRVGLKNCPYSHIHHGQIKPAKIQNCPCLTQMLVFIPVDSTVVKTALVILLNPDNHPAHPQAKPSAEDRVKLGKAVQLAGLTGLTAHKLLNAPATSAVYSGRRVAESSPAYTSRRKMIWVDHPSRQWIMDSVSQISWSTDSIFTQDSPEHMRDIIHSAYNEPIEQGNFGSFIQDSALHFEYPGDIPIGTLEPSIQDPTITFDFEGIIPRSYVGNGPSFDPGMAGIFTNIGHFPDFNVYGYSVNSASGSEILDFNLPDLDNRNSNGLPMLPMPQSSPSPPAPTMTVEEVTAQPHTAARKRGRNEVDEGNIVEGRRNKVQSRRARGEA
ncbi:hypothetical protein DFH07DRAFT_766394 [Mycena maculata]|uniref:Uncharacterized protein n=1 Tax=Mycena maculata TaxID=230809 RepID=A0AAD7NWA6_9AGAR|nr:hypothetical protein DFH07DRAFT_766394 [Mycena maculata]